MAETDVAKLGKKAAENMNAYEKASSDLAKLEKNISASQAAMKSGDSAKIAPSAVALAKLMPKLATQQKKVDDARKSMTASISALEKATKV